MFFIQKKKPRECPERMVSVHLNNCNEISSSHFNNGTEFDLTDFTELNEMPLCDTSDSVSECEKKKRDLVRKLDAALTFNEGL